MCKAELPLDQFKRIKTRRNYYWSPCRPCHAEMHAKATKKYRASMAGKYTLMASWARRRGLEADISWESFSELRSKPCAYCGGPLPVDGLGLDRLDNAKGYVEGNVAPCCTECNRIRSNTLSPHEMLVLGRTLQMLREFRELGLELEGELDV